MGVITMELFSIFILLLAAIFLWWVIKERGRNERERQVSVELVNRLFRLDERILKLEAALEQQAALPPAAAIASATNPTENSKISAETQALFGAREASRQVDDGASARNPKPIEGVASPILLKGAELDASRNSEPAPGRIKQLPIPSYVNGHPIAANSNGRDNRPNSRDALLSNGQSEAPKPGEFGMAALLCGIAFLMDDEQKSPRKPGPK